uniref:phage portal protein n=1 Tax=Dialister sp. TaxID=1955814 RepID=UPI004027EDBD
MFFGGALGLLWDGIIKKGARSGMTEIEFLEAELARWIQSPQRHDMLTGIAYYDDHQEIEGKRREMIGRSGQRQPVENLPNFKIMDNQYAKLVDQKSNYLLSKPLELKTEGKDGPYEKALDDIFNRRFMKLLKNTGKAAINCGIGWLYPYIGNDGGLYIQKIPAYQVLPFWHDEDHTQLDAALRMYPVTVYEGRNPETVFKVEYYTTDGVRYFIYQNNKLLPDNELTDAAYMTINGQPMNWTKVPLVAFKANEEEHPLILRVKCLQDGLNQLLSNCLDNVSEDVRNTVLVLKNYDGEDLGEFRRNLMTFGAVKVRDDDYAKGGVETLHIDVNPENYKLVISLLKRAIVENGRGFDAKDERFASGQANQMNIQAAYSDMDLDANEMESEFQSSLEDLLWFVNVYLANVQHIKADSKVKFIFNRDMLTNTAEMIQNCQASLGILSKETVVANHPWTTDTAKELERIKKEEQEEQAAVDPYGGLFGGHNPPGNGKGDDNKPPTGE